jgi:porin
MNAGFNFHGPVPHRSDDTLGLGMGYAKVSNRAADLDRDAAVFNKGYHPIRSGEAFIEATYQYQLTPRCQLQPDFQYVFNPGGGIANPNSAGHRVKNEAILGLRMIVKRPSSPQTLTLKSPKSGCPSGHYRKRDGDGLPWRTR